MPLPLPIPDLVSLDLLQSVAEFGSIRQASIAHNVSQPAASMRLRSLEKALGIQLLDRSSGRAELTPAGVAVVQWSEQILSGIRDLLVGTSALRTQSQMKLRLVASMTVAEYLVPIWLNKLRVISPEIAVSLQMGNSEQVLEVMRNRKADIGFVEGWSVPSEFSSCTVDADDLVVVVGPGHPWAHRKKVVTPAELARTPLVLREPGSGTREVLERALDSLGLEPIPLVELGSNTAIKSIVGSGAGPGVLSRLVISVQVADGRLIIVRTAGLSLNRSIRAIWAANRPLPDSAKRLVKLISK